MKADRNQVTDLWNEAFGDTPKEINDFLDIFGSCILTKEKDGKTVSQLFLIPGSVNSRKAFYLYAAATLKEYRGRGIMAELLSEASEYASENGADYIFLMPGEESLYGYYGKFGYRSLCFRCKCVFEAGNIPGININPLNFYSHDERVYSYAQSAYLGSMEIFRSENGTLIYGISDGCASVKEWHSDDICSLLREFTDSVGVLKTEISLPAGSIPYGGYEIKKHGMILPLRQADCEGMYYLDYVLD